MPSFLQNHLVDLASSARAARDIAGSPDDDVLRGSRGDDVISAGGGADRINGRSGADHLSGGNGSDVLTGGTGIDLLYGGEGVDTLFGDSAFTAMGADLSSDRLDGGNGRDLLVQGDGNDVMTGGGGADTFHFRWTDPMTALAAGTGRAFTAITDFDAAGRDKLAFDVAGVGTDISAGVNFVDGGAGMDGPGGKAATFFSGDADASAGEAVMVLTGDGYAAGTDAVLDAQGEAQGDMILYFNTTAGVASLLYVDGTDAAHSIARFTDINSLGELASSGFSANDFLFV